jgi:hypothetical protein
MIPIMSTKIRAPAGRANLTQHRINSKPGIIGMERGEEAISQWISGGTASLCSQ